MKRAPTLSDYSLRVLHSDLGRTFLHSFGFQPLEYQSYISLDDAKTDAKEFLRSGRYSDFLNFEAENSLMVRMRATTINEKTATPVKKRMSSVI